MATFINVPGQYFLPSGPESSSAIAMYGPATRKLFIYHRLLDGSADPLAERV